MVKNPTLEASGFRLGEFTIHPDRRTVVGPRGEVRLEPKVMAVLERLARTPREVVTRTQLLDEVWAGTVVTEEVLTRCISELRGTFDDRRDSPEYIQTVPKSGYRLLVTPAPLSGAGGSRRLAYAGIVAAIALALVLILQGAGPETVAPPDPPAIAILPFADLSNASAEPYFAEGLAEELMYALARVPGLKIASRTSSFAYGSAEPDLRAIGEKLNVTTVLAGSIRRAGDKIRVTAQLTAVDTGYQLWADAFDREITDVFAIQNEIAAAIARALQLELTQPGRFGDALPDVEAYDLYLLGRHHWHQRNPKSLAKASELFTAAIELDPNFALAYSGLADTYVFLASYGGLGLDSVLRQAEPAVGKALELGPQLAEPYGSLGNLLLLGDKHDLVGAQKAFERAIELNPHYSMAEMWLGNSLAMQGRQGDAHMHYLHAHGLDPLHPTIRQNLFWSFMARGEYDEAGHLLMVARQQKLEAGKTFANMAGALALERGRLAEAIEYADQLITLAPESGEGFLLLAAARMALEQRDLAGAALARAMALDQPSYDVLARVVERYALRGDPDGLEIFVAEHRDQLETKIHRFEPKLAGWRGIALARAGEPREAVAMLEHALDATSGLIEWLEPPEHLTLVSHLVFALNAIEEPGRAQVWAQRGRAMVIDFDREGWGSGRYQVAAALLFVAVGSTGEANQRMDDALALAWSPDPAWEGDLLYTGLDATTMAKLRLRQRETLQRERAKLQNLSVAPG